MYKPLIEHSQLECLPKKLIIAIDGPAGTGKSTVTRRLAERLHFTYLDTGALYRAVAFLSLRESRQGTSGNTDPGLAAQIAKESKFEFHRVVGENPINRIFVNKEDLTPFIRSPEISLLASQISAIVEVRRALLGLQQRIGNTGRTVIEGRDIGTVVFPKADLKFYLTALLNERAKRRLIEIELSGEELPSFEEVKAQILERDLNDANRETAPLRRASDAIEIDTTFLTLDDIIQNIEKLIMNKFL